MLGAVEVAGRASFRSVISHRFAEGEDTMITDPAVGVNGGQIKSGAPCRAGRAAKHNQVLGMEDDLSTTAVVGGGAAPSGRSGREWVWIGRVAGAVAPNDLDGAAPSRPGAPEPDRRPGRAGPVGTATGGLVPGCCALPPASAVGIGVGPASASWPAAFGAPSECGAFRDFFGDGSDRPAAVPAGRAGPAGVRSPPAERVEVERLKPVPARTSTPRSGGPVGSGSATTRGSASHNAAFHAPRGGKGSGAPGIGVGRLDVRRVRSLTLSNRVQPRSTDDRAVATVLLGRAPGGVVRGRRPRPRRFAVGDRQRTVPR